MFLTSQVTSSEQTAGAEARTWSATQGGVGIGAERRRGLRVRQSRPIKIFEPTTHKYFGGQTRDVSATGLRIELPLATPLRPGRVVNVHVGLSDRGEALANRRQMIPAKVVWIDRPADLARGRCTAGIEFISSTAAQLDAA
jgi:hypothetical protein